MYRSLALTALATGLVLAATPAEAKPEPIRGFEVSVKGDQLRATAQIPGPAGRKAQLQQLADGRWVTVAQTRTKPAKGAATPRARWRVAIADLRLPSAQSRVQAGPLAELIRLRAQSGQAKSKSKKVRVKRPDYPLMPKVVTGFIGSQSIADGIEALWSGQVRFEYNKGSDGEPSYDLVSASLTWKVEVPSTSCPIDVSGTFTEADLKGGGRISVPPEDGGKTTYQFSVRREAPVTLEVTCNGETGSIPFALPLLLNTLDCPSADPRTIPATYTGQPWTNRRPPYVFYGRLGATQAGICSDTLQPPGIFQSWDLTGSDLFAFTDFLAPLKK